MVCKYNGTLRMFVIDWTGWLERDFIWRGNNERGINLVNWSVVTKPRKEGILELEMQDFKMSLSFREACVGCVA